MNESSMGPLPCWVFSRPGFARLGDLDFNGIDRILPDLRYYPPPRPIRLRRAHRRGRVVISNKGDAGCGRVHHAPRLRLICIAATGLNNVDLAAATSRGVTVCNCRGYGTAAVVQHVFALLLALVTRLSDYRQAVRDGRWRQASQFCLLDFPNRELAGKTLGIVGHGELGRGVARVAEAFGMRVLIAQRPGAVEEEQEGECRCRSCCRRWTCSACIVR